MAEQAGGSGQSRIDKLSREIRHSRNHISGGEGGRTGDRRREGEGRRVLSRCITQSRVDILSRDIRHSRDNIIRECIETSRIMWGWGEGQDEG